MRDRRGEFDMAHALAPNFGERDLDAALLTDDALVLHALVLAAQALIVLHRPEDAGAEQPVALRLEGAVVDGFWLFDFAMPPAQDLVRAGQRDLDAVEGRDFLLGPEDIHQLLIHGASFQFTTGGAAPVRHSFRSCAWLAGPPPRGLRPAMTGSI